VSLCRALFAQFVAGRSLQLFFNSSSPQPTPGFLTEIRFAFISPEASLRVRQVRGTATRQKGRERETRQAAGALEQLAPAACRNKGSELEEPIPTLVGIRDQEILLDNFGEVAIIYVSVLTCH
jgi:hypothetical protein